MLVYFGPLPYSLTTLIPLKKLVIGGLCQKNLDIDRFRGNCLIADYYYFVIRVRMLLPSCDSYFPLSIVIYSSIQTRQVIATDFGSVNCLEFKIQKHRCTIFSKDIDGCVVY
jgi:hypothetical protein